MRARDRGLLRRDFRVSLPPVRQSEVVLRLRSHLSSQEGLLPLLLARRKELRGLCFRERRLGTLQLDLKGLGIDAVKDSACFHQAALLESALDDDA